MTATVSEICAVVVVYGRHVNFEAETQAQKRICGINTQYLSAYVLCLMGGPAALPPSYSSIMEFRLHRLTRCDFLVRVLVALVVAVLVLIGLQVW
jgi:hypothetical protein